MSILTRVSGLLLPVFFFATSSQPHAATWRVPGDIPTLQAGIDTAAAGDTVLDGENLTRSAARSITPAGRALDISGGLSIASRIEGLTFQNYAGEDSGGRSP
jgi:hypothetical protein